MPHGLRDAASGRNGPEGRTPARIAVPAVQALAIGHDVRVVRVRPETLAVRGLTVSATRSTTRTAHRGGRAPAGPARIAARLLLTACLRAATSNRAVSTIARYRATTSAIASPTTIVLAGPLVRAASGASAVRRRAVEFPQGPAPLETKRREIYSSPFLHQRWLAADAA